MQRNMKTATQKNKYIFRKATTRISEQINKWKVKKKTKQNKTETEKPTNKTNKPDVYCCFFCNIFF